MAELCREMIRDRGMLRRCRQYANAGQMYCTVHSAKRGVPIKTWRHTKRARTMKLFLFEEVAKLTSRWHSGGALIIIADNVDEAKKLVEEFNQSKSEKYDWCDYKRDNEEGSVTLTDEEWGEAQEFDIEDTEPRLWRFPNAGCC